MIMSKVAKKVETKEQRRARLIAWGAKHGIKITFKKK